MSGLKQADSRRDRNDGDDYNGRKPHERARPSDCGARPDWVEEEIRPCPFLFGKKGCPDPSFGSIVVVNHHEAPREVEPIRP